MKKTKICCFCEKWESGGIESFLFNVYKNIDLTQFEIDIVVSELSESIFSEPLKQIGINFIELTGSPKKILKNGKILKSVLINGHYDVFHINAFHALSLRYAKIASAIGISKIIAHSHNTALRKSTTKKLKYVVHKISVNLYSKYITDFWACSQWAADFMFLPKIAKRKSFVFIPNAIDTARFRFDKTYRLKKRKDLGIEDDFVIGCVGRLCEQKNQIFLIKVLAEAIKIRQCKLLLVGEGKCERSIRKLAEDYGVSDKVIFYGVSSNINNFMCCFDCLAMPSLFEGLGIVAIEAQCLGINVICSEYVPSEAYLSDLIKCVPLINGEKEWAYSLLNCSKLNSDLQDYSDLVYNAGFDIHRVSDIISKRYKGDCNG